MSDRQLAQYWYHHLRVNRDMLMSHGACWEFQMPTVQIDPGETFGIEFITDERPVLLSGFEAYVPDNTAAGIYVVATIYENGVVLPGTIITGHALDRVSPQVSPVLQFSYYATRTAETGLRLGSYLIQANDPNMAYQAFWILKPYTQYDISFLNYVPASFGFTGDWNYTKSNNSQPANGVVHHSNNNVTLVFNDVDESETSRFADLQQVVPGSLIQGGGVDWEVVTAGQGLGTHAFDVVPQEEAIPDQLYTFDFYLNQPVAATMAVAIELSRLTRADLL